MKDPQSLRNTRYYEELHYIIDLWKELFKLSQLSLIVFEKLFALQVRITFFIVPQSYRYQDSSSHYFISLQVYGMNISLMVANSYA